VSGLDLSRPLPAETIEVKKLEHETVNFGGIWHSDTAYLDVPPMASMLLARELPPWGGDTRFANMYLAWDTLSEGLKRTLEGLRAVNSSSRADVTRTREDRIKSDGGAGERKEFNAERPVARTHLALWDNRCAQHNPVNDYHGHRRLMHRITLAGDRPA
jgi:taurine dioxygenase